MSHNEPVQMSALFQQIMTAEQTYLHAGLKSLGLNVEQARLLKYVSQHPGCPQKAVAADLGRQSATVTNMLKVLEARDVITRKVVAGNERQKQLFLTEPGTTLVAAITTLLQSLDDTLAAALPKAKQAKFKKRLQAIVATLNEAKTTH